MFKVGEIVRLNTEGKKLVRDHAPGIFSDFDMDLEIFPGLYPSTVVVYGNNKPQLKKFISINLECMHLFEKIKLFEFDYIKVKIV